MKVIDSGAGISQEGLQNLFVDFGMLKENISNNTRGTGLGLSICKQIITKMGGHVAVESELNKGTTFIITILTVCQHWKRQSLISLDKPREQEDIL